MSKKEYKGFLVSFITSGIPIDLSSQTPAMEFCRLARMVMKLSRCS
jgi:hypothetical protein